MKKEELIIYIKNLEFNSINMYRCTDCEYGPCFIFNRYDKYFNLAADCRDFSFSGDDISLIER